MNSETPARYRTLRQTVATCLVIAFALYSSNRVFIRDLHQFRHAKQADEITRYEKRFERLRSRLPLTGIVGLSRTPPAPERGNIDSLYAAQYALCPVVLSRRTDLPLVIANFDSVAEPPAPPLAPGLQLIEDFGDGVQLFHAQP